MRVAELDGIEKAALLNVAIDRAQTKWFEFTVRVSFKRNRGSFGIKHEQQGVFKFCAQLHDGHFLGGYYVKGVTHNTDTTRIVEMIGLVPVAGPVGDPHDER